MINSSKNHYNTGTAKFEFENHNLLDLKKGNLSDMELSYLLHSADLLLLPYTVSSASGVMFDGLGHGHLSRATFLFLGNFQKWDYVSRQVLWSIVEDGFETNLKSPLYI